MGHVKHQQKQDWPENIALQRQTGADAGGDQPQRAPEKGVPQPGQRPHQRRFNVINRVGVHIFLLAVFLLHRRGDPQQQRDDMRRGIEEHQMPFQRCGQLLFARIELFQHRNQRVNKGEIHLPLIVPRELHLEGAPEHPA